jgi:hypothetical protein
MIAFVLANIAFFIWQPEQTLFNWELLIFIAPIWMPIVLTRFGVEQYVQMLRTAYLARQNYVMLELRMPRDTMKSPAAMEAVLASIHFTSGEATWWKKYGLGQLRPETSLEIVSLGGRVHFYIRVREAFRRALESAFYAQYPDMEIIEAEDYSRLTDPAHSPNDVVGFEYVLGDGKNDAAPLKTYVDYGLEAGQKPEEQIDPLAQMLELLGALGPHEQLWMQMVLRTTRDEKYRGKKNAKGGNYTFKDHARETILDMRQQGIITVDVPKPDGTGMQKSPVVNPSKGNQEGMFAIERKMSKILYDVGIRALYTAPESHYQGIVGAHLVGLFKAFASGGNSLGVNQRWSNYYSEFPWEDPGGLHQSHSMHRLVDFYRRRSFYHPPYKGEWSILSIEEIATMYHVLSAGVMTPSVQRVQSATSAAPVNLPQ